MIPPITAIFEPDLRSCAITMGGSQGGFTYEGLRVKYISGFVTKEDVRLYQVLVPSEADIGHNVMVAFGQDAVWGYRKSNWSEGAE